jgi:hypothetical protein
MADGTDVRFTVDPEELLVVDSYCLGTGKHRSDVMREILRTWSEKKLHEATVITRVAGNNGSVAARERKADGNG